MIFNLEKKSTESTTVTSGEKFGQGKQKTPDQKSNLFIYDNTNMDYSSTSSTNTPGKIKVM